MVFEIQIGYRGQKNKPFRLLCQQFYIGYEQFLKPVWHSRCRLRGFFAKLQYYSMSHGRFCIIFNSLLYHFCCDSCLLSHLRLFLHSKTYEHEKIAFHSPLCFAFSPLYYSGRTACTCAGKHAWSRARPQQLLRDEHRARQARHYLGSHRRRSEHIRRPSIHIPVQERKRQLDRSERKRTQHPARRPRRLHHVGRHAAGRNMRIQL